VSTQTMERQAVEVVSPRNNVVAMPPRDPMAPYPPKIAKAIMAIRRTIHPVAKSGTVEFGKTKYNYPKADDVMDQVIPLTAEHGLIITQSEVKQVLFEAERMLAITYAYTVVNEDGDVWPERIERTGLAWVKSSRGEVDDKASNKCSTQSEKYFYIKFFGIRTSDAAQLDNDALVPGADKAATPKPPKPGSAEAAALDGPRMITGTGPTAESWAEAFIKAIENATPDETKRWCEINNGVLAKLEAFPDVNAKVAEAIKARAPKPPKPPKPGAQVEQQKSAPVVQAMPDPTSDAAGWIIWLRAKMDGFNTHEAGEAYWNDHIDSMDLPREVQEDAMGVWRSFEVRFEP
jgi:hypothetical protein